MIENQAQYEMTKGWRDEFARRVEQFDAGYPLHGFAATHPVVRKAIRDGLQSMVDELTAQMEAYDAEAKTGGQAR